MELYDVLRRMRIAAIAFFAVLIIGTLGFGWISDGRWFDAFYMTVVTITTIGFHEVIDLSVSPEGRIFTVFIAFSGIGILTYLLSNTASLFIEGDINRSFIRKRMEDKLSKIEDHFIICGCGRVGRNIAEELLRLERKFVLCDTEEDHIAPNLKKQRINYIIGDSTNEDVLSKLGIDRARGIFITAGEDNTNLVITLTARQMNPDIRIIVRVKDISQTKKIERAGADQVVSPNYIGGVRMASEMIRPSVTNFLDELTRNPELNVRIEELDIPDSFKGSTVEDLPVDRLENTLLLAIKKDGVYDYKPDKNLEIGPGSTLLLLTTPGEKSELIQKIS